MELVDCGAVRSEFGFQLLDLLLLRFAPLVDLVDGGRVVSLHQDEVLAQLMMISDKRFDLGSERLDIAMKPECNSPNDHKLHSNMHSCPNGEATTRLVLLNGRHALTPV